jgi:hypothetical protein
MIPLAFQKQRTEPFWFLNWTDSCEIELHHLRIRIRKLTWSFWSNNLAQLISAFCSSPFFRVYQTNIYPSNSGCIPWAYSRGRYDCQYFSLKTHFAPCWAFCNHRNIRVDTPMAFCCCTRNTRDRLTVFGDSKPSRRLAKLHPLLTVDISCV